MDDIPTPVGIHFFSVLDKAVFVTANRDARTIRLIVPPGIKTLANALMIKKVRNKNHIRK